MKLSSCSFIQELNGPENSSINYKTPKRFEVPSGTIVKFNDEFFTLPQNTNVITLEEHGAAVVRAQGFLGIEEFEED